MLDSEIKKSTKDNSTHAIVVGVGSIGYGHLRYVVNRYANVVAIDTDHAKLQLIENEFGRSVATFGSIEDFFSQGGNYSTSTAVVSNLGPDHFSTVEALLEKGVRRIYLEKPVSDSIANCQDLVSLQRVFGARIMVGFGMRHSGIVGAVNRLDEEHCGSTPSTIVVHGGALDMSTNGIHWLDFACALFHSMPTSVIGSGSKASINPRREDLFFWDGTLTWNFEGNRKLSVIFDNQSSVSATVTAYCRNGVIVVGEDGLTISVRNTDEVSRFPSVTRHGSVTEKLRLSSHDLDIQDWREEIFSTLEEDLYLTDSFSDSAEVTSAMLAGLWAVENHEWMELPVNRNHPSFFIDWNAS